MSIEESERAELIRLRALRDKLAAGMPYLPRSRAGQIVPTLAESRSDFIGPLNPWVGTWSR